MYKKITLYIVRLSYNGTIHDSAPCKDCTKTLQQLGIKRIVYSNNDGDLTSCKMHEYIPKSSSLGRRFIESDFQLGKIPKKKSETPEQGEKPKQGETLKQSKQSKQAKKCKQKK